MSSNINELLDICPYFTQQYLNQQLTIWFEKPTEYVKHELSKRTGKGDSYLSDIFRVVLHGKIIDSDDILTVNILFKCLPKNIARSKSFRCTNFFENEINFYLYILPELVKFQKERGIPKPFESFPKLFGAATDGTNDFLALEDMNVYGFGPAIRQEGIDYAHCEIILESFAKYHAISFALKDQNPEKFSELAKKATETYYDEKYWDWYKGIWRRVGVCAIDAVEKEYPGTIYVDKIKSFAADKTFFEASKVAGMGGKTAVFGHGDAWTPNFLVKYKPGTAIPENVVMIDFQLGRCASPVLDIGFFFYGCSTQDLRNRHYQDMLKYYHNVLSEKIKELGSDPNKLYPWELFIREIKDYSFFGLAFSMESTPVIILDPEDAFDVDNITGTEAVDPGSLIAIEPIKTKAGRLRLADNIVHAVDNGYI